MFMFMVGLDPRPDVGRSLIARGEAGMEASVRKTLGVINRTATSPLRRIGAMANDLT
jgi:hypothetical protein